MRGIPARVGRPPEGDVRAPAKATFYSRPEAAGPAATATPAPVPVPLLGGPARTKKARHSSTSGHGQVLGAMVPRAVKPAPVAREGASTDEPRAGEDARKEGVREREEGPQRWRPETAGPVADDQGGCADEEDTRESVEEPVRLKTLTKPKTLRQ